MSKLGGGRMARAKGQDQAPADPSTPLGRKCVEGIPTACGFKHRQCEREFPHGAHNHDSGGEEFRMHCEGVRMPGHAHVVATLSRDHYHVEETQYGWRVWDLRDARNEEAFS